ncbi:hypothetical protein GH714_004393 [Hevea brasiliensis]|uniref:Brf1 TBP-binding domain-containing protein n=1 Tax=Hevea brasiliensis TaxID=3981 RepID=A0A6A6KGR5_HEVBR|nr:hypothetical protein GH714_004393 [Hevea brasiliensis]
MEKQVVSGGLDLTGINDAEIVRYVRDEKEIELRKIMWELLQRDYSKRKRPQQEKKKGAHAKKALKIGGVDDQRKSNKKKTMSSKINYDMLKKLEEEISTSPEIGKDSDYSAAVVYQFFLLQLVISLGSAVYYQQFSKSGGLAMEIDMVLAFK